MRAAVDGIFREFKSLFHYGQKYHKNNSPRIKDPGGSPNLRYGADSL